MISYEFKAVNHISGDVNANDPHCSLWVTVTMISETSRLNFMWKWKKKYSFQFLALWNIRSFWTNSRPSRNKSITKFYFSISTLKHVCPYRMKTHSKKIDLIVILINCNDVISVTNATAVLYHCWPAFWFLFQMIPICFKIQHKWNQVTS